jgi:hypothetical protein
VTDRRSGVRREYDPAHAAKRADVKDWRKWVLATTVLWIIIVAFWTTRPMTAVVHTGFTEPGHLETVAAVQCDSPLSGNTSPTETLPELKAGRAFDSAPCELPIENGRVIFAIDCLMAVGVVVVVVGTQQRSNARHAKMDAQAVG